MKPGENAALAISVGYVLGRQHKLRAAALLGAAAAAGRLGKGPLGKMLGAGDSPPPQGDPEKPSGQSGGVVSKLGGAGKSAAVGLVTKSADRLGDALNQRAAAMRGNGQSQGDGSGGGEGDNK